MFEPRVGLVFVAASEAEYMMAPSEDIRDALSEVLTGVQLGAMMGELLHRLETVELDLFVEGTVGELNASAGQWLGFVTLV